MKFGYLLLITAICSLQTPYVYAQTPVPSVSAEVSAEFLAELRSSVSLSRVLLIEPLASGPLTMEELSQTASPMQKASSVTQTPPLPPPSSPQPVSRSCCICFEQRKLVPAEKTLGPFLCNNADWGALCKNKSDLKINCTMIAEKNSSPSATKDVLLCKPDNFLTTGLNTCTEKYFTLMTSSDYDSERRCMTSNCYNKNSAVPTNTTVFGNCSGDRKADKIYLCEIAKKTSALLEKYKSSSPYIWFLPEKPVYLNDDKVCLDPNSAAFLDRAEKVYKIVASADGVTVFVKSKLNPEWKEVKDFCDPPKLPAKGQISLSVWGSQKQCAPCRVLKKELAKELARLAKKGITLKINDHDSNTTSEAADAARKATKLDVSSVPFAAVQESSKFKKVDALEYIKAQEKILDDKK